MGHRPSRPRGLSPRIVFENGVESEGLKYSVTLFLSAALLFLAQPLVARLLLPWFGGSAEVWTACQLTFQLLLLAGYGWTHLLVTRASGRVQVLAQGTVVALAVVSLGVAAVWFNAPLMPAPSLRPLAEEAPLPRLLLLVLSTVGLPFFALATTGPLVQAWATRAGVPNVARLYALSNVGSLVGLLVYPTLVEPQLTLPQQGWLFGGGVLAWAIALAQSARGVTGSPRVIARGTFKVTWLWLAALPVALLLSVTQHLTQEVSPTPFLWVLPLAAYLLSFVVAFSRPVKWTVVLPLLALSAMAVTVLRATDQEPPLPLRVALFVGFLLVAALACHGALAATRPTDDALTGFYAALSLGGALGGVSVGLLAPRVFSSTSELEWALGLTLLVVGVSTPTRARWWWLVVGVVLPTLVLGSSVRSRGQLDAQRDFFGVVRVLQRDGQLLLLHGRTIHGVQQLEARGTPTAYYAKETGVGQLLAREQRGRHVGLVGLGAGTLAAWARPGDVWRFFEISPAVMRAAEQPGGFTFLSDARARGAQVEVVQSDGRTALEQVPTASFDVLVADAFSGDSVPVHLLTVEAMKLYASRLSDDGVLAVHLTNRSLDLAPFVARSAEEAGFAEVVMVVNESSGAALRARWMLMAKRHGALNGIQVTDAAPARAARAWTDDFSSVWNALVW